MRLTSRGLSVVAVVGLFLLVMLASAIQGAPSIRSIERTAEPAPTMPGSDAMQSGAPRRCRWSRTPSAR